MQKKRRASILIKFITVVAVFVALSITVLIVTNRNLPEDEVTTDVTVTGSGDSGGAAPSTPSGEAAPVAAATDSSSPISDSGSGLSQTEQILNGMTLRQKLCQMLLVTPESITGTDTVTDAGETMQQALDTFPVGGIIYFAQNLTSADQVKAMIAQTQSYSGMPLFIAVDEEGGSVARIGNNPAMETTAFPPMAVIGMENDADVAYKLGAQIGEDISHLGFNLDFAPVADIKINISNTEIGSRAFSSDPAVAARMVAAVVKGLQDNAVSATLKHFPGHGSAQANSHNGYSESARTLEEFEKADLLPFAAGIDAGADFVMISHMSAINVTGTKVPCSLSKVIITDLLREQLHYQGIVITDALQMGAIASYYSPGEAAVLAVKAGADMLLCPADVSAAVTAVMEAVESGDISVERIDNSVRRILQCKINRGVIPFQ